jgi:fumarate reductase flavoprotein subunit
MATVSDSEIQVPLVVVGAGAAGLMAALYTAHLGMECVLLEKSVLKGTNAELSGGLLQAAGTRFQQSKGVEDSPELMASDIMTKNSGAADEQLVLEICRRSKDFVHFLDDHVIPLHLDTAVRWPGHSAHRMHTNEKENGRVLVNAMRAAIRADDRIAFVDRMPVRGLIERNGAVTGVVTEATHGDDRILADRVVLATTGFGANRDMLAEYCPQSLTATFIGSENSTGEGIRWGIELGAATAHMSAWQGHCHVNPKYGTHLSGAVPYAGAVIVNRNGRRFAREDKGYSEFTVDLLAQPDHEGVEIFDQKVVDQLATNGILREAMEAGAVRSFNSIEELAAGFHLPVEELRSEVAAYNSAARGDSADDVGRTVFGAPLDAPFYGSAVTGGLAHTQGGLVIDTSCRVLRPDGSRIDGLYAVGGAAEGISGDGAGGYTSGNGLAHAMSTGLIAAEHAAHSVESVR